MKERCFCDAREIDTTAAFHYVQDKPVCSSFCYRTIMSQLPPEMDGFQFAGENKHVET